MNHFTLVRDDQPSPHDSREGEPVEDRVRELEAKFDRLQETVAGWEGQTARLFEVAEGLRSELKSGKEPDSLSSAETQTEERLVVHAQPTPAPVKPAGGSSWLLFDILADLRDMCTMVFDARYKRTWTVGLLVPLLIAGLIMSWLFNPVPVVSQGLELLMGLTLFKVMNRELVRYRAHLKWLSTR